MHGSAHNGDLVSERGGDDGNTAMAAESAAKLYTYPYGKDGCNRSPNSGGRRLLLFGSGSGTAIIDCGKWWLILLEGRITDVSTKSRGYLFVSRVGC